MKNLKTTLSLLMFLLGLGASLQAATIFVTNTADSGAGSLRNAVMTAVTGDIIKFGTAVSGNTITLTSGEIAISAGITIAGTSANPAMISAGNSSRIFNINTTSPVKLSYLNLSNGMIAGDGGAVMSASSNVTYSYCTFSMNSASASGGAVYVSGGQTFFKYCTFSNNVASGAAATQGGGAFYSLGATISTTYSTFTSNMANGASGSGGAILNGTSGMLTVAQSTFTGNTASRAGGAIEGNSGASTNIAISGTTFMMNNTGPAPGNGGAVHITGAGNCSVTNCTVSNNVAALEGGGLWNGTGIMTVSNTMISGNQANGSAANTGGGGLHNNGGILKVINGCMITNNMASGASGSGGGILNDVGGRLSVSGSTISGNSASRAGGGIEDNSGVTSGAISLKYVDLINNATGPAPGNGGGLHITGAGGSSISYCVITGNTATREGGGVWNGSGTMTVSYCTIDDNAAAGPASDDGGGGVFNNGGTLNLRNSTISNNTTSGSAGNGGGVHNPANSTMTISKCTVSGNSTLGMGGGVFNSGTLKVYNATVTANTATGAGGGIGQNSGSFALSTCIVAQNMTSAAGIDVAAGGGTVSSLGYNLIGADDSAVFPSKASDMEGTMASPINAMLAPLANNGGSTMTHALMCGSPAINTGNPNQNSADQIGMPVLSTRDRGAFELQSACRQERDEVAATLQADQSRVYPNPTADGYVTLEIPASLETTATLTVINEAGQVVRQQNVLAGTQRIDLSAFAAGVYHFRVQTDAATQSHKVVIMK